MKKIIKPIRNLFYKMAHHSVMYSKLSYEDFFNLMTKNNDKGEKLYNIQQFIKQLDKLDLDHDTYFKELYIELKYDRFMKNDYDFNLDNFYKIADIMIEGKLETIEVWLIQDKDEHYSFDELMENIEDISYTVCISEFKDVNVFKTNKSGGLNLPRWYKKSERL